MAASIQGVNGPSVRPVLATGDRAKGEFRCVACGYGVAVHTILPACPMCRGEAWESARWRPFTRASARFGAVVDALSGPGRL